MLTLVFVCQDRQAAGNVSAAVKAHDFGFHIPVRRFDQFLNAPYLVRCR